MNCPNDMISPPFAENNGENITENTATNSGKSKDVGSGEEQSTADILHSIHEAAQEAELAAEPQAEESSVERSPAVGQAEQKPQSITQSSTTQSSTTHSAIAASDNNMAQENADHDNVRQTSTTQTSAAQNHQTQDHQTQGDINHNVAPASAQEQERKERQKGQEQTAHSTADSSTNSTVESHMHSTEQPSDLHESSTDQPSDLHENSTQSNQQTAQLAENTADSPYARDNNSENSRNGEKDENPYENSPMKDEPESTQSEKKESSLDNLSQNAIQTMAKVAVKAESVTNTVKKSPVTQLFVDHKNLKDLWDMGKIGFLAALVASVFDLIFSMLLYFNSSSPLKKSFNVFFLWIQLFFTGTGGQLNVIPRVSTGETDISGFLGGIVSSTLNRLTGRVGMPLQLSGLALFAALAFMAYKTYGKTPDKPRLILYLNAAFLALVFGLVYMLSFLFPVTGISTSFYADDASFVISANTFATFFNTFIVVGLGVLVGYLTQRFANHKKNIFIAFYQLLRKGSSWSRTVSETMLSFFGIGLIAAILSILASIIFYSYQNGRFVPVGFFFALLILIFLPAFAMGVMVIGTLGFFSSNLGWITNSLSMFTTQQKPAFGIFANPLNLGTELFILLAYIVVTCVLVLRMSMRMLYDQKTLNWGYSWQAPVTVAILSLVFNFLFVNLTVSAVGIVGFTIKVSMWYAVIIGLWMFVMEALARTAGILVLSAFPKLQTLLKDSVPQELDSVMDHVLAQNPHADTAKTEVQEAVHDIKSTENDRNKRNAEKVDHNQPVETAQKSAEKSTGNAVKDTVESTIVQSETPLSVPTSATPMIPISTLSDHNTETSAAATSDSVKTADPTANSAATHSTAATHLSTSTGLERSTSSTGSAESTTLSSSTVEHKKEEQKHDKTPIKLTKKQKLIMLGVGIVIVILLAISALVSILNNTVFTPQAVAKDYLSAISSGDFEKAVSFTPNAPEFSKPDSKTLLTNAVGAKVEHISDVTLGNPQDTGKDLVRIPVNYALGTKRLSSDIMVKLAGKNALFLNKWEIAKPFVTQYRQEIDIPLPIFINSVKVNFTRIDSKTYDLSLPAFPGIYTVEPQKDGYMTFKPYTNAVQIPSKPLKEILYKPTQKFYDEVNAVVKKKIDACAATKKASPEGCDFEDWALSWDARPYTNASWTIKKYPKLDKDSVHIGFGPSFDTTSGEATFSYDQADFDGSTKHNNDDVNIPYLSGVYSLDKGKLVIHFD